MNEIHQFSRSCRPLSSSTTFADENCEGCNSDEGKLAEVEEDGQLIGTEFVLSDLQS